MRGLPHHLVSLLIAAVLAMGTAGLRATHVSLGFAEGASGTASTCCAPKRAHGAHGANDAHLRAHGDDTSSPCAPTHSRTCSACEQIDAIAGVAHALDGAPTFLQLIAALDQPAPAVQPAPTPPRVVGARPPPTA